MSHTYKVLAFFSFCFCPLDGYTVPHWPLDGLDENPFGGPSPQRTIREKSLRDIKEKAFQLRQEELTKCYYGEMIQNGHLSALDRKTLREISVDCQSKNPTASFLELAKKSKA